MKNVIIATALSVVLFASCGTETSKEVTTVDSTGVTADSSRVDTLKADTCCVDSTVKVK